MTTTKLENLSDVTGNNASAHNSNNDRLTEAFEKTLSRDGSSPNEMESDLDMNGNRILNLPTAVHNSDPVRLDQAAILAGFAVPVTADSIGEVLYPQTAAELAASVTPTYYYFPPGNVFRYGATGDGSTDDYQAFADALLANAGLTVTVPDPDDYYKIGTGLQVPDNTTIRGSNKRSTKIMPSGNIDLMTLGNGAILEHLYLDGNGTTSRGLVIAGTNGNQTIAHCRVINFDNECIEFTSTTSGSRSSFNDIETWQTYGTTGSGKYAIKMASGSQLTAVPRKFSHIETSGYCAFDFGGSNDVFVDNSFLADLAFTTNSRSVHVTTSRIANQTALTINGPGVTFTGCSIYPDITVSGSGPVVLEGNYYNGTITDESTTGQALICNQSVSYTPTWTGASSNPSIGNGTLRGEYSRNGDVITLGIEVTMGSSTTYGSGAWRFAVPMVPNTASGMAQNGTAYMLDSGTTFYIGSCQLANGGTYLTVYPQMRTNADGHIMSLDNVKSDTPFTWATGDVLRLNIIYFV